MCVFSSVIPGTKETFVTIYALSAGRRMCPFPHLQAVGAVMWSRATRRRGVLPALPLLPPWAVMMHSHTCSTQQLSAFQNPSTEVGTFVAGEGTKKVFFCFCSSLRGLCVALPGFVVENWTLSVVMQFCLNMIKGGKKKKQRTGWLLLSGWVLQQVRLEGYLFSSFYPYVCEISKAHGCLWPKF